MKHILKVDPVFWPVNTHKWKMKTGMEVFLKKKKLLCSSIEKGYNLVDTVPFNKCPDGFILDGKGNLLLKLPGSTPGEFEDTGIYDPKYEGFVETEYVVNKKTGEQIIRLHDVSWYTIENGNVVEHNMRLPDDPMYNHLESKRGLGCQNINLSKKELDIKEVRKKLKEIPEPEIIEKEAKEEMEAIDAEVTQAAEQTIWDILRNLIIAIINAIRR